jgi:hypothetical protein
MAWWIFLRILRAQEVVHYSILVSWNSLIGKSLCCYSIYRKPWVNKTFSQPGWLFWGWLANLDVSWMLPISEWVSLAISDFPIPSFSLHLELHIWFLTGRSCWCLCSGSTHSHFGDNGITYLPQYWTNHQVWFFFLFLNWFICFEWIRKQFLFWGGDATLKYLTT